MKKIIALAFLVYSFAANAATIASTSIDHITDMIIQKTVLTKERSLSQADENEIKQDIVENRLNYHTYSKKYGEDYWRKYKNGFLPRQRYV